MQTATWLSVAMSLLLLLFLILGEYSRRVHAAGVILPTNGMARIAAPAHGWIMASNVREGDEVQQGDVLYRLAVDSITERGGVHEGSIDLLQKQRRQTVAEIERRSDLSASERQQLTDDLEFSSRELQQIEAHHALLQEFVDRLEQNAIRQEELVARGHSTLSQMEPRQQVYMSYRLQRETLRRDRILVGARISQLARQLEMHEARFQSSVADLRQQLVETDREISQAEARREIHVVAPRSGYATGVIVHEGQTVAAGSPMLTIVPKDAHLHGELLVPGQAVGFISEGDRVMMRYESFPHQRFGQIPGRIRSISRTTLRPDELDELVADGSARHRVGAFYRVTVEPERDGFSRVREEDVRPGMAFEAYVVTEKRRLYEWLLSPLYRMADGVAGN